MPPLLIFLRNVKTLRGIPLNVKDADYTVISILKVNTFGHFSILKVNTFKAIILIVEFEVN